MQVASGDNSDASEVVFAVITVERDTRMIPFVIVDERPNYSVLLGKQWMASVGLHGEYENDSYSPIQDKNGKRVTVPNSICERKENRPHSGGGRNHRPQTIQILLRTVSHRGQVHH